MLTIYNDDLIWLNLHFNFCIYTTANKHCFFFQCFYGIAFTFIFCLVLHSISAGPVGGSKNVCHFMSSMLKMLMQLILLSHVLTYFFILLVQSNSYERACELFEIHIFMETNWKTSILTPKVRILSICSRVT